MSLKMVSLSFSFSLFLSFKSVARCVVYFFFQTFISRFLWTALEQKAKNSSERERENEIDERELLTFQDPFLFL